MKKLIVSLGILLLICGCSRLASQHHYIFIGESPSWDITYEVNEVEQMNEGKESRKILQIFTLIYKNDIHDLESVDRIQFAFENDMSEVAGEHVISGDPPENKTFIFKEEVQGSTMIEKTEIVDAMVRWGGTVETFQLHYK